MSQEHNQCLVTDTSAARSSSLLLVRDVRDELERSSARGAHTTLLLHPHGGLPSPARRSPPTLYLLRRAGPVNRGAIWGWIQLDGRRLLLGHFDRVKALPTPRERRPLLLPPSALSRASCAGPIRSQGPEDCFGEGGSRTARSRQRREAGGSLTGPPPYSPRARLGAQGTEGLPRRRSSAAGGSLRLSLSQPVSWTRAAPRGAHQSPAPTTARESTAVAVAALLADPRSRPREGLEGGGGARKGKASPPPSGLLPFRHTHSAPPHCLFDSQ